MIWRYDLRPIGPLESGIDYYYRGCFFFFMQGVIDNISDLVTSDRQFLLFDLVAMPHGQGGRKERGFFLFSDLLIITSIKRRSGTIRKPNP